MGQLRTGTSRAPHPSIDGRPVLAVLWAGKTPPRRWFHGLLAVPVLLLLWSCTRPGGGLVPWLLVSLFAPVWLVRLLVYAAYQRRLSPWFAVAPLAGALCLGVVAADLPLRARWAYAHGDFDRYVRELPPRGEPLDPPGRLGGYALHDVWRNRGGVVFTTTADSLGAAGFAWFPEGPGRPGRYEHLSGPWYTWSRGSVD